MTAKPYDVAADATDSRILAETFLWAFSRFIYSDLLRSCYRRRWKRLVRIQQIFLPIMVQSVTLSSGEGLAAAGLNISNIGF